MLINNLAETVRGQVTCRYDARVILHAVGDAVGALSPEFKADIDALCEKIYQAERADAFAWAKCVDESERRYQDSKGAGSIVYTGD